MRTLKEIASLCNVSESTVSLALNKPYKISEPVRTKIYTLIQKKGYSKLTNKIQNFGILVSNLSQMFSNEFYGEVIEGILGAATEANLQTRFMIDLDMDYYSIHNLQGFIFLGKQPDEYYAKLIKYRVPLVACGSPPNEDIPVTSVYIEREEVGGMLANYLVSCGHKNIAVLLGDHPNEYINTEFLRGIIKNNPYFNENMVFVADYDNYDTVEIVVNQIMSHSPHITAVICGNDLLAYYFYRFVERYGLSIPADISITGFDAIKFPRFVNNPNPILTTAAGDKRLLGKKALELLKDRYLDLLGCQQYVKIPSSLVIGGSVGRV
ncbi:MAG: LacI family DNA-binding transcriptional regulator [Candidatus Margulisbacteria bacterium]|nr:LacI family DNA-binding transcriptional regulator [Candidatus Margulisiibacteriota bacterium]